MLRILLYGLFTIAALMVVGSVTANIVYFLPQSRNYRTDLRSGQRIGQGRFPFWQMNVLNRDNYNSPEGGRFHRKMMLVNYVQWIGLFFLFTCLVLLDF